jgi:benzoyl-CoA reductase/2-hydroxyglutaryl-CoA dehydratase subunit BcrC/BadD/HgdB
MTQTAGRITLAQWDQRYAELRAAGLCEPEYGGPLRRHVADGDLRLLRLRMDNSAAALRLWNFLLTEEDRLRTAQAAGKRLVGAMKDLGTVPVMAFSLENLVAFYTDGAWWIPCLKEQTAGLLAVADSLGIDDSFCPVRAMLGAFLTGAHFPIPGLLTCSVGATCDDFSAIAQRLDGLGFRVLWWEALHRRSPEPGEPAVDLPGTFRAPQSQVALVRSELERVRGALESYAGRRLTDGRLAAGIRRANHVRRRLAELRQLAFTATPCPLPGLELLVAEMLAIHFCSDQEETSRVLDDLLAETRRRVAAGIGVLPPDALPVFWVNPVADLRVMNLLEDLGGRVCGTDYLFCHALDEIPADLPPMEALARMVLADPMVGSAVNRAERICTDIRRFGAAAVVISRIPGASHCGLEGTIIAELVREQLGIPVAEIEVPPITDSLEPTLRTRLEALIETARHDRGSGLGKSECRRQNPRIPKSPNP